MRLGRIALLRNAFQENLGLGLQINHEVRRRNGRREHVEIAFVKLELFIVEVEISENLVALEEKIADDGRAIVLGLNLSEPAMAFVEKIHLRTKGSATFLVIEIGEERVVIAVEDTASVKLLREHLRKR